MIGGRNDMSYLYCTKCKKYVMTERQIAVDDFVPIPYEVNEDFLEDCEDEERFCEDCGDELDVVKDYDDGRDYSPDESFDYPVPLNIEEKKI